MLAGGQRHCQRFRAAPGFHPGGETRTTGLELVIPRGAFRYAFGAERNACARICLSLAVPSVSPTGASSPLRLM